MMYNSYNERELVVLEKTLVWIKLKTVFSVIKMHNGVFSCFLRPVFQASKPDQILPEGWECSQKTVGFMVCASSQAGAALFLFDSLWLIVIPLKMYTND